MAANPMPSCWNLSRAFCNWTSCCLQKGHQSAERKNSSTTPLDPIRDERVALSQTDLAPGMKERTCLREHRACPELKDLTPPQAKTNPSK